MQLGGREAVAGEAFAEQLEIRWALIAFSMSPRPQYTSSLRGAACVVGESEPVVHPGRLAPLQEFFPVNSAVSAHDGSRGPAAYPNGGDVLRERRDCAPAASPSAAYPSLENPKRLDSSDVTQA